MASHNGTKSMNRLTVTRPYIHFRGTCVDIVGTAKDFQWLPQDGSFSFFEYNRKFPHKLLVIFNAREKKTYLSGHMISQVFWWKNFGARKIHQRESRLCFVK